MISYFAMATGQGITYVPTHYDGKAPQLHRVFRQVFYARKSTLLFGQMIIIASWCAEHGPLRPLPSPSASSPSISSPLSVSRPLISESAADITGYIDWLLTTPLLLISLAFLAGLSPIDGLLAIFFDVAMIVTGLLGGLTPARWHDGEAARWGFFGVSCVFFLGVWWVLLTNGVKGESSSHLI